MFTRLFLLNCEAQHVTIIYYTWLYWVLLVLRYKYLLNVFTRLFLLKHNNRRGANCQITHPAEKSHLARLNMHHWFVSHNLNSTCYARTGNALNNEHGKRLQPLWQNTLKQKVGERRLRKHMYVSWTMNMVKEGNCGKTLWNKRARKTPIDFDLTILACTPWTSCLKDIVGE